MELRENVEDELDSLLPGDWIIIGSSQALESAVTVQGIRHLSVMATNVSTLRETLESLTNLSTDQAHLKDNLLSLIG